MSIGSTIVPRADLDLCAYHLYNSYSLDTVTFQRRLSLAVGSFVCDHESNWPAFFLSPIYLIRMNHCDRRYLDVATDERSFIFFNCVVLFFFLFMWFEITFYFIFWIEITITVTLISWILSSIFFNWNFV